jgi:multisubunit Na+/H+ antiporter MnhB subunit
MEDKKERLMGHRILQHEKNLGEWVRDILVWSAMGAIAAVILLWAYVMVDAFLTGHFYRGIFALVAGPAIVRFLNWKDGSVSRSRGRF